VRQFASRNELIGMGAGDTEYGGDFADREHSSLLGAVSSTAPSGFLASMTY
jgi:hypothetical protein